MGTDFENDYQKFEEVILECIENKILDDAVIGKDEKEQVNIWGIREDVAVLADERKFDQQFDICLLYTSPSPRDRTRSRMPSSA